MLYHRSKILYWEIISFIFVLGTIYYNWYWLSLIATSVIIISELLIRSEKSRSFIGNFIYNKAIRSIPTLSKTEQEVLNTGDTWFEKDIFTGNIDWKSLESINTELTSEEQDFLNNETGQLCDLLDEWSINQSGDLPTVVWDYINTKGFFGLVISKQYGGKGFSARAHSDIIIKIASRSVAAAVTVMVPNSLGPGELLQSFGTKEQQEYYLPRLATGLDIPCFALTEPTAGSDATSIQSDAIVVQQEINGQMIIGLRINLNKRWITLAPVASLIGLAVNLKDPDNLLRGEGIPGITCLLISRDTENLEIGSRHLPANQAFMNGPIRGNNIFVPIKNIIGGQKNAGRGWQMLIECLSVGRAISLPALASASSTLAYLTTGAFARIRKQFNTEILQFEGVQEKLAEIAGLNYLINATRRLTLEAVTHHKKPAVVSAITKYYTTELARKIVNAAMDVHAGQAIVVGPRNYLASNYSGIPIMITVEGANIMTRNLLIFSQGAMLCHPFIRHELEALHTQDRAKFGNLIWEHVSYFLYNLARAICTAFSGGIFLSVPKGVLRRERQRLTRLAYAFAWLADLSLIILGKKLKRKEFLAARLADGLSYVYMALAVIQTYQRDAKLTPAAADNVLHAKWSIEYCCYHAQRSMLDYCANFPQRWFGKLIKLLVFPCGQTMSYPRDTVTASLAKFMASNNTYRLALKELIHLNLKKPQSVERIENTLQLMILHSDLYKKISDLNFHNIPELQLKLLEKVQLEELTQEEMDVLLDVERLRLEAIQVDEFP